MGTNTSIGLIAVLGLLAGLPAFALEESNLQTILTVTSDTEPGMKCILEVMTDKTGLAEGLTLDCDGKAPRHDSYTVDQIRTGVVITHDAGHNIDVLTMTMPDLDPAHGGAVKLHYLSNFIGKSYADFNAQAVNDAGHWMLYTSADKGQQPFNQLFSAKRTFLGKTVGIKSLTPSFATAVASVN
jgi:hypothetical protein